MAGRPTTMPRRSRLAILISGRGSNMAALIYASKNERCPYEPVLVTGNKPKAPGLDLAEAEGVDTARLDGKASDFWDRLDETLRDHRVDMIALAGFMRIIPDDFIKRWEGKIVNIHPSLLPKYKGIGTHQAALDAGDRSTGATVHLVIPELDSGEILGQVEVAIVPGDTAQSIADRVLIAEHQLYPRVMSDYLSRTSDPEWLLEKVRGLALSLDEAIEKESHGTPGFLIEKGKFFAYFSSDFYGDGPALMVKTSGEDEQTALIEQDPDLYFWPKYLGASGWIAIRLGSETDWSHVADWLQRSWIEVAPARLAKLHKIAAEF